MTDPNQYLVEKLQHCTDYQLSDADLTLIAKQGVEAFIFKTLTSKKFRKWAIDASTQDSIKKAIHFNVENNQPIQVTLPFGAYKLWRLPSAPEIDWAEFFTVSYYGSYFAPVVAAYKPGLRLSFWSDDIIVERLNNVSPDDTAAYRQSLEILLDQFRNFFPKNLTMKFRRVADLYPDQADFERDLLEKLRENQSIFQTLPDDKQEQMLRMSKLNVRWDGVQDLTHLSEEERQKKIEDSAILHEAYRHIPRRRAAVRAAENIIIFPDRIASSIGVGSTSLSVTKFWTSFGILEQRPDRFVDRILSPEQFERMKDVEHAIIPTDLIPLRNFSEIWIYSKTFDFS